MSARTPRFESQSSSLGEGPVALDELQRLALNQTFVARGLDWYWDATTLENLRRVGNTRRQLDEYGFRTGDLLTYDQLIEMEQEVNSRLDDLVLDLRGEQAERAWVA